MGRQNTIRIDYGDLPNKPGMSKVQKFCADKLGLKRGEVIRIQNSQTLGVTFVTVTDLTLALKVCEEHGKAHELTGSDKKQHQVTITIEDGTVLVKLFDLSADVSNADIAKFLERYGEVRDVYEEQLGDDQEFAGAYTGIRVAKMVVRENIASWITINGEATKCQYYAQKATCKHCHDYLHIGVGCVQNKKLLVQKTFADAVKQPAKPQQPAMPQQPLNPQQPADQQQPLNPQQPINPKQPKLKPNGGKLKPSGGKSKLISDNFQTKPTDEGNGSSLLMPPPADVQPSGSGLIPAGGAGFKKSGRDKSDGHDTDSSTSSRKLRPKGKKPKYNDDEEDEEEEI